MTKIDLKKELKYLYASSAKEVVLVDVPEMGFLMIDGQGDPNTSQEFVEAVEALNSVSNTLKFRIKKVFGINYVVMPLEGLWRRDFWHGWKWTLMIMQPEQVTKDLFEEAFERVKKKKNPPALSKIRFESFYEGLSAQIMYIGPYSDEVPTIKRIHRFITENGYKPRGKQHEIYLSDSRRVAPEKMKTILRQPVEQAT